MYKCDKCGCEHSSRTTCPKCGAPVVIVNEDYLLRRQQWEEQQRNNLRYKKKGENGTAAYTGSGRDSTTKECADKENGHDNSKGQISLKERYEKLRDSISKLVHSKFASAKANKEKKEKEKNAEELKDKRREKAIKLRRRRIYTAVAAMATVVMVVTAVFVGIHIYKGIDRSDVIYFDGHEMVSVAEGVLFSMDGNKDVSRIIAYNDNLNAFFLQGESGLIGWYEGKEHIIDNNYGSITDEHVFSQTGRYLACVSYDETNELYSIILHDMAAGESAIYTTDRRVKLIDAGDNGSLLFCEMDTTEYSTVINMELYVADMDEKLLLCDDVSEATRYYAEGEYVAYISGGKLYTCSISKESFDKYDGIIPRSEHILVNEAAISITPNLLARNNKKALLYITEEGLWLYDGNETVLAARGVSVNCEVYYGDGFIYYRDMNTLYCVKKGQKQGTPVIEEIQGDIIVSETGKYFWTVSKDGILYKAGDTCDVVDDSVNHCAGLYGGDGCAYVKEGKLICIYEGKQYELGSSNIKTDGSTEVIYSKKHFYFRDLSNVLWKIAKNGSNHESLGYVKLAGYSCLQNEK